MNGHLTLKCKHLTHKCKHLYLDTSTSDIVSLAILAVMQIRDGARSAHLECLHSLHSMGAWATVLSIGTTQFAVSALSKYKITILGMGESCGHGGTILYLCNPQTTPPQIRQNPIKSLRNRKVRTQKT